eukprot:8491150-Pyramimonas_sp.AAC.1
MGLQKRFFEDTCFRERAGRLGVGAVGVDGSLVAAGRRRYNFWICYWFALSFSFAHLSIIPSLSLFFSASESWGAAVFFDAAEAMRASNHN